MLVVNRGPGCSDVVLDYGQYRSDEYREIMHGIAGTDSGHWYLDVRADCSSTSLVLVSSTIHIFQYSSTFVSAMKYNVLAFSTYSKCILFTTGTWIFTMTSMLYLINCIC